MRTAALQVETVSSRRRPQVVLVRVTGEVDCANAWLLGQALTAALAEGSMHVEVDLAQVSFFDCAALRALERAGDAAGPRMRLVAASEAVRWLLRLSGMQERFGIAAAVRLRETPGTVLWPMMTVGNARQRRAWPRRRWRR